MASLQRTLKRQALHRLRKQLKRDFKKKPWYMPKWLWKRQMLAKYLS